MSSDAERGSDDDGLGLAVRFIAFLLGAPCVGLGILWLSQPLDKGHIGRMATWIVIGVGVFFLALAFAPTRRAETALTRLFGGVVVAAILAVVLTAVGSIGWTIVRPIVHPGFCDSHTCVGDFGNGNGYVIECADGTWSHSGGRRGACSSHGGEGYG